MVCAKVSINPRDQVFAWIGFCLCLHSLTGLSTVAVPLGEFSLTRLQYANSGASLGADVYKVT